MNKRGPGFHSFDNTNTRFWNCLILLSLSKNVGEASAHRMARGAWAPICKQVQGESNCKHQTSSFRPCCLAAMKQPDLLCITSPQTTFSKQRMILWSRPTVFYSCSRNWVYSWGLKIATVDWHQFSCSWGSSESSGQNGDYLYKACAQLTRRL